MKYKELPPNISDPITQKDNFTTKLLITFWDSMIFKLLVLCLTILEALSTIPIIRLLIKYEELKNLVTSIALYIMPHVNAQKTTDNKNVVCQPLGFIFGNTNHNNRYNILHLASL